MRRRDRWAGLTWVTWMEGDSAGGQVVRLEGLEYKIGHNLYALTHDYRRYVEMEFIGAEYAVRVVPAQRQLTTPELDVGLLYTGASLSNILRTAMCELDLLQKGQILHRLSREERARWVA